VEAAKDGGHHLYHKLIRFYGKVATDGEDAEGDKEVPVSQRLDSIEKRMEEMTEKVALIESTVNQRLGQMEERMNVGLENLEKMLAALLRHNGMALSIPASIANDIQASPLLNGAVNDKRVSKRISMLGLTGTNA
jgi:hypothetical protein